MAIRCPGVLRALSESASEPGLLLESPLDLVARAIVDSGTIPARCTVTHHPCCHGSINISGRVTMATRQAHPFPLSLRPRRQTNRWVCHSEKSTI
ncbi:hypothetical protein AAFF_G00292490 [Aldrovandia affinis]|uniref:Uncharacterized protein n=1 Tax=Aldrovandia affinis TaxID=143900 RepID=A0AAD7SQX3_9TELE|nr:hypothetical protein AAFF_G00292490 [Aldrovandia affinis]